MNELTLAGCAATPLASYLKALGVLRLLYKRYPAVRGTWRDEHFAICAGPDAQGLARFLLDEYSPTPVVAPWNAGSGFYFQERKSKDKDPTTGKRIKLGVRDQPTEATRTVEAVFACTNERFATYRSVIEQCRGCITDLGLQTAPEAGPEKDDLVLLLRNSVSDDTLEWIDAALLITSEGAQFPPLLGTGGNDGNLDFTSNFMQCLLIVIGSAEHPEREQSRAWLCTSLFGDTGLGLLRKSIGQFSPGQAGGINATTGFEAHSSTNPWDFVLMIEGAMLFAAAAVRRNANESQGALSYPFTVRTVDAGAGNLGMGDSATTRSRGELWLPLWSQPTTLPEVRGLLSEGRVALGRKPARDSLDFVRAVHRLGGYRGIQAYERYALLKRNGNSHLATPLQRVSVASDPRPELLDELDQYDWLTRFRRFAQGDKVANRFLGLRRQLEDALFRLTGRAPAPSEVQALLTLLGNIQAAVATSMNARGSLAPIPRLSERWVRAAYDGTAAFRVACAVAGLAGTQSVPLPVRAQLFPIQSKSNAWIEDVRKEQGAADDPASRLRFYVDAQRDLPETLIALLNRRLWLAEQLKTADKPLQGASGVDLDDLIAFLRSDAMDRRITTLLPGLSLCSVPRESEAGAGEAAMPSAFALLKLPFVPESTLRYLRLVDEQHRLRATSSLVAQLATGNATNRAIRSAWRCLRTSGLSPVMTADALPELDGIDPRRAAAALLIPLRVSAVGALARGILKAPATETV